MNKNHTRRASRSQNRSTRRDHTRAVLSFLILACALAAVASGALFRTSSQAIEDISPEALAQIDALVREKESRSDVQKKIDSQLIYQTKMGRGQVVADNVSSLQTDVVVDDQGKTIVDITARVTTKLVATLPRYGAVIISARNNSIRALVPLESLESIAAIDAVKFVQPKQDAMTGPWPQTTSC